VNPSIAESNPSLAAEAPTAGLEPTALASRRGIAILLLLSRRPGVRSGELRSGSPVLCAGPVLCAHLSG
jgi:hypothetical protein